MKLKKWGSLLTALAMLGSMAASLPVISVPVSAAEVVTYAAEDEKPDVVYSGDLNGVVDYTLNVTKKTLTLSSHTGGEYVIPNCAYGEDAMGILQQIVYDNEIDTKTVAIEIAEINIDQYATDFEGENGAADVFNGITFAEGAKAKVHCQSPLSDNEEFAVTTGEKAKTISVEAVHEWLDNTTNHTHICKYNDALGKDFSAHDFTYKIDTKNGTHSCSCGKTDADYISDATEHDKKTYYATIHTFDADTHKCSVCGSDNKQIHNVAKNIEVKADDKNTHSTKCATKTCDYVASKEQHTWAVNNSENSIEVNKEKINAHEHYCTKCGYHEADAQTHDFKYVIKPVYNTEAKAYKMTPVLASKNETGLVCECGTRDPKHDHPADFNMENGFHYCLCGELEGTKGQDGTVTPTHTYNYKYSATTGELVYDNANGVVCKCGAVSEDHKSHTSSYVDTVNHKHKCACGADVTTTVHGDEAVFKVVKDGKHLCECGLENPNKGNGHDYKYNFAVVTNTTKATDEQVTKATTFCTVATNENGAVCIATSAVTVDEAGKTTSIYEEHHLNPAHKHEYDIAWNEEHYCSCGQKSTDENVHEYENGQCKVCGKLENHTHTPNPDDHCACSDPKCNAEDLHTWTKVKEGVHLCTNCGDKATGGAACDAKVIDKTNHQHKCSVCGKVAEDESVHTFENCVCQDCGLVKHGSIEWKNNNHVCSVCGKTVAHNYDADTDVCKLTDGTTKCKEVKPGHKHEFKENQSTTNIELCRCGEQLDHEWALAAKDASKHACIHKDASEVACKITPVSHTYDKETGFCECGAVDPTKLADAHKAKSELAGMASTHTASYIVSLTKAVNDVLAYATTDGKSALTDETKINAVTLAKTTEEQTTFNNLLKEFTTVYGQKDKNQSGSTLILALADDSTGMGTFETTTIGGNIGDTVVASAKQNPGYEFEGWYSDKEASATKKLSSDINYSYKFAQAGSVTIYAKFVAAEQVAIILPAGVKYKTSSTELSKDATTNNETIKFAIGEEVTLVPVLGKDEQFQSFKDSSGATYALNCKSDDKQAKNDGFKFIVTGKERFELNTYKTETGKFYIIFASEDGKKEYAMGSVVEGGSIAGIEPTVPARAGLTFVGWKYSDDDTNTLVRLRAIAKSGTLVPVYEPTKGLKLTISGGDFALEAERNTNNDAGFTYGTQVTLTAEKKNEAGKFFSGWYANGVLVSENQSFMYTITDNASLEAKFEGNEELVAKSRITITNERTKNAEGQQVILTADWAMAKEAVTIIDTGYVFAMADVDSADLTLDAVDNTTIRKKSTGLTDKTGKYVYTMNLKSAATKNATVCAKVYVTYTDANGQQVTVYSDMANIPAVK